jgi:hypothetical protein
MIVHKEYFPACFSSINMAPGKVGRAGINALIYIERGLAQALEKA